MSDPIVNRVANQQRAAERFKGAGFRLLYIKDGSLVLEAPGNAAELQRLREFCVEALAPFEPKIMQRRGRVYVERGALNLAKPLGGDPRSRMQTR